MVPLNLPSNATTDGIERDRRASRDRQRSIYRPPWRIDVVRRAGTVRLVGDAALARVAARALTAAAAPGPASVTIVLTDDAELTELNAEHMGVTGATDVLSFPMLPPESFGRPGSAPPAAVPRPPRARIHVGDIAISVERAIAQAEAGKGGQTGDVRWSAADEVRLLVTHGVLHLCGWDHAEPAEESAMRQLERRLLAAE